MIQKTNIKLFSSERLDDTSEGGGRITGNEIISGQERFDLPRHITFRSHLWKN